MTDGARDICKRNMHGILYIVDNKDLASILFATKPYDWSQLKVDILILMMLFGLQTK